MSVRSLNLGFGFLVILLVGAAIRFAPLGSSPYPLNDGGLFTNMAGDLAATGFWLPKTTTYNGALIPFAYPPLGLYIIAGLESLLGIPTIDVVRWLPAVVSVLCIGAMYLLASEILRSQWRGLIAAGAFALMPRSFVWLVVGGGVTRSLGMLFALLAIRQGVRMLRHGTRRDMLLTAGLGGLTFLAHPQAALFLAVTLLVLFAFHLGRERSFHSFTRMVAAGLGALVVASPWLLAVVLSHGVTPLISAGQSAMDLGAGASSLLGLAFTDTPVLDLMTAFGVLGVLLRIARGQWMIPVWLAVAVVVDPRAGTTFATVPLALSVVPIIGELIQRMVPAQGRDESIETTPIPQLVRSRRAASILLALILFATLRTAARTAVDTESPLHGLDANQVAAMEWTRGNVPDAAPVALVTGLTWERDFISEWFPVLAAHRSPATVQGSEWTGRDAFLERLASYRQLQRCADLTDRCVTEWANGWLGASIYVFLPKGRLAGPRSTADCCPALRETMLDSPDYRTVYDGPGATIFAPVR